MTMNKVKLGKTGIVVNKNGFGALPIQRVSMEDAAELFLNIAFADKVHSSSLLSHVDVKTTTLSLPSCLAI